MSWRIKVKSCINGLLYAPGVNPLSPLLLLAFFMGTFANSMVLAMPFTFLPRLMKDFNIKEVEVGKYVGITASSLYIGRTLTSYLWGWLFDTVGRRRGLLITNIFLIITTTAFGFSTTFSWAFTTRFLQGFLGGTAIALVTCAFGVCDETNSSIGNSFLLGGFSIGLIIGPAIGGLISFPSEKFPNTFKKGSFFDKFPVLLPVMVSVLALCVALMLAYLYIPESVRKGSMNEKTNLLQHSNPSTNASNKRNGTEKKHKWNCWSKFKEASFFKLMRQQPVVLAIILYSLVAFYETGFDDLLPIFADSPIKYGGLGFSTEKIGYAIILSSIPVLFLTFVMGRIEKMVGMRDLNFIISIAMVFVLPLFPYVGALNPSKFWHGLLPALIVMRIMLAFSLFTSTYFVNYCVHPKYLGSVNGISMTLSCIFRAVSPSLLGFLYSWALNHKDNRFPFNHFLPFFLCSIAVLIVVFMTAYIPKNGILYAKMKEIGSSADLAN